MVNLIREDGLIKMGKEFNNSINMRRFIFIIVIILVPILTMAQASGGQITKNKKNAPLKKENMRQI